MAAPHSISPTDKAIRAYHQQLGSYQQHSDREGALSNAFFELLRATSARVRNWTPVGQDPIKVGGRTIKPDATLRDEYKLPHGYWEAKDTHDDLDTEIRKKFAAGYPTSNIIFEDTREGILYQNGQEALRADLANAEEVARLLNWFYQYSAPNFEGFKEAVGEFQKELPPLALGLKERIDAAHKNNKAFQAAFAGFYELCQNSLNPNISKDAVNEMLIQHLLTERLIRRVFDNPDFAQKNVIAAEIEKVIGALTSQHFSRTEFLGRLDRYYEAIEGAADGLNDFSEKQKFLNTVYERFFQGYSVRVADTHGIVYTPTEIVEFMCASVEEVLREEFGVGLGDEGVNILDPATGTGNFIVHLMQRIPKQKLEYAYRNQLFANEVMLLPYYIAALNIEHAYVEAAGKYEPFEGLCFVDTLELAEGPQMRMSFMTAKNTERVERQKQAPITVIIGNPPYNVGQLNENDNNKNRKYEIVDQLVRETYASDSAASNKNSLFDAYVKFFRWATDRLQGRDGVVCFVSNNGFLESVAFDGMRKHLFQDFNRIYALDLKGNVRKDSMRDGIPIGEEHTVFGLAAMVGISITLLERNSRYEDHRIYYHAVDWRSKRAEKFALLQKAKALTGIEWQELVPDRRHSWLIPEHADQFATFLAIGSKATKSASGLDADTLFKTYGGGVKTNRDEIAYDFNRDSLAKHVKQFIENYNGEVDRYRRAGGKADPDQFVSYDSIKWSRDLKLDLQRGNYAVYDEAKIRISVYRPFCKQYLFFDRVLNEEVYVFPHIFPTESTERENQLIWLKVGSEWPMFSLATNHIVDLLPQGGSQCFPFYVYNEDGTNRRENITDWALKQFRDHYDNRRIDKWDIFYYVYGLLHHPGYRSKYANNLKRELPRIPYAPDFKAFSAAGKRLAELHLNYEKVEPYELKWVIDKEKPISYRVEKMRLVGVTSPPAPLHQVERGVDNSGASHQVERGEAVVDPNSRPYRTASAVKVNESLTLEGIPAEAFEYRLGNRSALEWVIDQYRVKTDERSGIVSDPNDGEDEKYIVELVGRVVRVSVETVKVVKGLPEDFGG